MKVYSGAGNIFVITKYNEEFASPDFARSICKDIYDGFMMVKDSPLEMVLYNRDGTIASMCGNGIRCFINFCYDEKIISSNFNIVKTPSGNVETHIVNTTPFTVLVYMNDPKYIYLDNKIHSNEHIIVNDHHYDISIVNTGVWHGVIIPTDFNQALSDAKAMRDLPEYQEFMNLDFVSLKPALYVKTYERGVGFTKACGTGSMATYIILKDLDIIKEDNVIIKVDGGKIKTGKDKKGFYIESQSEFIENFKM